MKSEICNLRFAFCILHFAFCIASSARADAPVAVPIEGEPFRAKLVAADARWQLTFAVGKEQRTIPAGDLVRWGRCAEQGRAGGLVLADGSLLVAEVVAADKDVLTADSDLFGTMKLPLDLLAGIVLRPPSDRQQSDALLDRLGDCPDSRASENGTVPFKATGPANSRPAGDSDRLLLDNGDELAGFFEGLGEDAVTFKSDAGAASIKIDRVTAILFNPALRRKPPANPPQRVWTGFSDGSRLLATKLIVQGDATKITAVGQTFAASHSLPVFLQPLSGRAVYLSDLKPAEYRQTPFLLPSPIGRGAGGEGLSWPYRRDRNVTGGMLRAGGRLYLKGIGVHSAARLVYTISPRPLAGEGPGVRAGEGPRSKVQGSRSPSLEIPKSQNPQIPQSPNLQISKSPNPLRRFQSLIAIDDSTAGRGSAIFRVLVDGRERFASPIVRGGDRPLPVSVDIRGASRLELQVDYADRGDVLDHADWLDARLTR